MNGGPGTVVLTCQTSATASSPRVKHWTRVDGGEGEGVGGGIGAANINLP